MPDDTTTTPDNVTGAGEGDVSATPTPTASAPEPAPAPAEPESQPQPEPQQEPETSPADVATSTQSISTPPNTPSEAPESTTNAVFSEVVKDTTSVAAVVAPSKSWALSLLPLARAKMQLKKQKKLDKVVALAAHKRVVVSRDVELLLHVSAATATRYLEALVKAGHLRAVGAFRHTRYEFVG